ncbi:MAG: DUF4142 domain-containing protein [Gammaproteobacteria bacterium]
MKQFHRTRVQVCVAAASLILLGIAPPVGAQPGSSGFVSPDTETTPKGTPRPNQANTSDRLFVQLAAIGGMSEVQLGKLAQQNGASDPIQAFGKQMVQDHGKANDTLAKAAKAADIPLPDALDPTRQAIRDRLEKLKGAEFDLAYLAAQLSAHQLTAQLLEYEIGSGQDQGLKNFATATLPIVLEHLDRAQKINGQLRGATAHLVSAKDMDAKSSAPSERSQPPSPHTQCASGS